MYNWFSVVIVKYWLLSQIEESDIRELYSEIITLLTRSGKIVYLELVKNVEKRTSKETKGAGGGAILYDRWTLNRKHNILNRW